MSETQRVAMRVGAGFLSAHVRSVVESFVYLMQRSPNPPDFELADSAVDVELFDQLSELQAHLKQGAVRRVYIRGFEPFALAAMADAVIDRPLRPSVLQATLQRFGPAITPSRSVSTRESAAPLRAAPGLLLSADELLGWLNACGSAEGFELRSDSAHQWICKPALREVCGAALDVNALQFDVRPLSAAPPQLGGKPLGYDQWVYWIARCSSSAQLLDHDEQSLFMVERGALSVADSREFAKLAALMIRPVSVQRAAELARQPATVVRRFLNANQVLGRLRAMPATAPAIAAGAILPADRINAPQAATNTPAPPPLPSAPPASRNLFSRLLSRLLDGPGDVR